MKDRGGRSGSRTPQGGNEGDTSGGIRAPPSKNVRKGDLTESVLAKYKKGPDSLGKSLGMLHLCIEGKGGSPRQGWWGVFNQGHWIGSGGSPMGLGKRTGVE
jgi:hypothetical protein